MKQEYKQLLIKDLCARLPYGVKARICIEDSSANVYAGLIDTIISIDLVYDIINEECSVEDVKPYLFPMSSMTEEQKEDLNGILGCGITGINKCGDLRLEPNRSLLFHEDVTDYIDWLNEHHYDFRDLIGRNLAIDATGLNIY